MEEQTTVYATNRFVPTLDHYRQAYSDMLKRSTLLFAGAVALMFDAGGHFWTPCTA